MLFKSQVYTAASGSIGGVTYAHNKGGMYTRARATPTNPRSPLQILRRSQIIALTQRWSGVLSETERINWKSYASQHDLPGPFGDPHEVSGIAWYIKSSMQRLIAGLTPADAGEMDYYPMSLSTPVYSADESDGTITVAFGTGDAWAGEVGGFLNVFQGYAIPVGRGFYGGPFRHLGTILGAATPPTSPQEFNQVLPLLAGHKTFFRAVAGRADGRVTPAALGFCTAAA